MKRILALAFAAVIASCGYAPSGLLKTCQSDAECAQSEVCFPLQGCGDPGGGLVVEVQGNTRIGQFAQDFPIGGDGGFQPINDFEYLPATVGGEFVREGFVYPSAVTVRARGTSELIPGLVRSYQATFPKPERGAYSLPIGAGSYVVTAETADQAIPPAQSAVKSGPGIMLSVNFAFAPQDKTIAVTGRLLKRIEGLSEIPVGQPMDVQAFEPLTLRALSQRSAVTTSGDFTLFVSPEANDAGAFVVIATPRDPGSIVPSKTFPISLPLEPVTRLLMGDFGAPLPQMQGKLVTTALVPVAGANVYLEGPVNGGGIFRSKVAITDDKGVFRVDLLPSADNGSYLVTALPPPNSVAGVAQKQVQTIFKSGQLPMLRVVGVTENPSAVVCPDKITVIGKLVRPGGKDPAIAAKVIARAVEPLKELSNQPLPMGDSEGITDESGRFSLELDPGVYQLDFVPGEDLPRTSRIITVRAQTGALADGGVPSQTIDLGSNLLRKGRKVSGTVTAPSANTATSQFTVRYFRVSPVGGTTSSLLLGEALTDGKGAYSVVLPAK